ncbi:hypothetical protein H632_c807p0 [Helicosporidium sp. ATCC 50920]|nr:hypothetical protein H632_c807p0 [Helicosporidium sp. ATCC 50920]|eukprot:KDD75212.1 hypothetical protein H632_c807p0 [Helicosporidium sp. ATCC 50920]
MENWSRTIPSLMAQWNVERSQLIKLLASTRDGWIAADLRGWTGANRLYSAVGPALHSLVKQQEAFIVTTKQAQYVDVLLRELAGVELAPERIVSTAETGEPKATVLEHLQARFPDTRYHFVEDRAATLESVAAMPEMERWKLHLADWGYNTPEEREACRARPDCRIEVLSRRQLFKAFVQV